MRTFAMTSGFRQHLLSGTYYSTWKNRCMILDAQIHSKGHTYQQQPPHTLHHSKMSKCSRIWNSGSSLPEICVFAPTFFVKQGNVRLQCWQVWANCSFLHCRGCYTQDPTRKLHHIKRLSRQAVVLGMALCNWGETEDRNKITYTLELDR